MNKIEKDNIFYGLLATSLFFMTIGMITITYSDTALLNSKPIGILQAFAGLVGVLHCYKIINHQKIITHIIQLSIVFRVCSYITELIYVGYRPALLVGALIWTLIWAGYFVVNRLIAGILTMQNREAMAKEYEPDQNTNELSK